MLGMIFLFFLLFPSVSSYGFVTYDFATDMQQLNETRQNDECFFNASEITTVTIEQWPTNCTEVWSIAKFTSRSSEIPYDKLKNTFKTLSVLRGAMRIENTTFTNLSFFGKLRRINNIKRLVTSITDNNNLKNANVLFSLSYTYPNAPIQIVNNPQLDVSALCENINYENFAEMYVYNNLKDCGETLHNPYQLFYLVIGCVGTNFTSSNIGNYANCTSLFGDTEITGTTGLENFSVLSKVKNITGRVNIHDTSFENLSFFGSVERMKGNKNETNFNLHDNPNLTRLGMDSLNYLYNVDAWFVFNISNNHPEFCLTMEEMQFFTSSNIYINKFEAKFCDITTRKDGEKVCIYNTLATLDNNCPHVMGNILVASGDENDTQKLSSVKYIYGSLAIVNTSLTDLSFLGNLTNVAVLGDTSPALQLISNPQLDNVYIPNLQYPFSPGPHRVVIRDNAPGLFPDTISCLTYENQIKSYVFYDGADCYGDSGIVEETENSSRTPNYPMFLLLYFTYFL
ncbi:hypothetical protein B9Z55_026272 [Caenorhabditis nigoni]|uniref:Receptor L-domain domain-containing protein n=2 Tax=Caenorhabditis nigoni TaxID=1611254 RepID=A0A2G5T2K0_9PELO|nr:hypothetical protein B9Z55_026272 [Caenorhabditis nigoni]